MDSTPKLQTRRLLALPAELAQSISDFRFAQRIASESAATRTLIKLGLAAAAQKQDPKP